MSKKKPKVLFSISEPEFRTGCILIIWFFLTFILGIWGCDRVFGEHNFTMIQGNTDEEPNIERFNTSSESSTIFVMGLFIELIILMALSMILKVYAIVTSQRFSR